MIEVDYVKISFQKVYALKSYRPKHPPERFFFEHVINMHQQLINKKKTLVFFSFDQTE